MDRKRTRIQQIYGYAVCLITIVVTLIAVNNLINASLDLTRPAELGRYGYEAGATSFEAYKLEHQGRVADPKTGAVTAPALPDSVLRSMYDAERSGRVRYARWEAQKSLITNGVLLIVALILFTMHWRWLRHVDDDGTPTARD
jgi:hypothetical protein